MARQNSSSSSIPSRSLSANDQTFGHNRDEKVSFATMQTSPLTEQSWGDESQGEAGEPEQFELCLCIDIFFNRPIKKAKCKIAFA